MFDHHNLCYYLMISILFMRYIMTSLIIHLPDELAEKAKQAGLLDSENLIHLLNKQLDEIEKISFTQQIFQPFQSRHANVVTNEQINQLRDIEGI